MQAPVVYDQQKPCRSGEALFSAIRSVIYEFCVHCVFVCTVLLQLRWWQSASEFEAGCVTCSSQLRMAEWPKGVGRSLLCILLLSLICQGKWLVFSLMKKSTSADTLYAKS